MSIFPTRSILPTLAISTIGLPPCCPCGEDHGLNNEGRCPACERANSILQARLESADCPGEAHGNASLDACPVCLHRGL